MTAGRPTLYKPEMVDKVDEYLEICQDEELERIKQRGNTTGAYEQIEHKLKVNLPTIEGFALFLEVSLRVLYDWRDKYPEFLQALGRIEIEQKKRLLNMGLSGDYNSTIAKLILSSNHGMAEKSDVTSKGERIVIIPPELINKNATPPSTESDS